MPGCCGYRAVTEAAGVAQPGDPAVRRGQRALGGGDDRLDGLGGHGDLLDADAEQGRVGEREGPEPEGPGGDQVGGRVAAFDMLGARLEQLPSNGDPAADLIAAGTQGFRPFALTHPALFRIGIQQVSVPAETVQAIIPAAERALPALHRRIARLRDAGLLGDRTVAAAAWEFHAACEGLAALELRCALPADDGQQMWQDTLGSLVTGWQHVTPANRHDDPPGRP